MSTKLTRASFTKGANGELTKSFHIEPVTDEGTLDQVQAGTQDYKTYDPISGEPSEEVARVVKNEEDPNRFTLVWVKEGSVLVKATADADQGEGTTTITGEATFDLVDEATKLNIVAD